MQDAAAFEVHMINLLLLLLAMPAEAHHTHGVVEPRRTQEPGVLLQEMGYTPHGNIITNQINWVVSRKFAREVTAAYARCEATHPNECVISWQWGAHILTNEQMLDREMLQLVAIIRGIDNRLLGENLLASGMPDDFGNVFFAVGASYEGLNPVRWLAEREGLSTREGLVIWVGTEAEWATLVSGFCPGFPLCTSFGD
jgi:hypothetical protein